MGMNIAVVYEDGQIFEHFGHCNQVAIYEFDGFGAEDFTKRIIDCGDRNGHSAMVELMKQEDVAAVICGRMGDEARSMLLTAGIVPVLGYMGPADDAAVLLVTGRLPVFGDMDGSCSGGCGGCSGGCGCGDDGDCGCGCH